MRFSIIIPVYNVEKYLEQCLNSVLNQTFTDYEVICVNDGSTDESLTILRRYEKRYQHLKVIDTKNGGTASARNIGLENATGEYIWFVDSDDWVEKNSLQIFDAQLRNKQLDVLCFNGKLIYEEDKRTEFDEIQQENFTSGWEYYNKYAIQGQKFHFVCVVLRVFRREFLMGHNLFFDKNVSFEDNLWIPQVFYYAKNVEVIADYLYFYLIREGSKMATFSRQRAFDTIIVANKLAEFFIPKNIDKSVVYREIAGMYFSVFMPPKNIVPAEELRKQINWDYFNAVAQYPRHRMIYRCLTVHYRLFQLFIWVEKNIKNLKK
ncbi:MAG: glycosyltransferase [Prevotellaceae bacterium]|nr:glycosyltransferase [Prevotellaceae bacterium]